MSSGNVKVVVRCRPLNSRENSRGAKCLIKMEGNTTYLSPPQETTKIYDNKPKAFTFDKSYWSGDITSDHYASQKTLFDDLGVELLDHAFQGFNTCIFAYGQTGSGKSYTMMGYGNEKGVIPLICEALFARIAEESSESCSFTVEASYIEIYQEKVKDLLNPSNTGNLKVREHPTMGPYVESLSKLAVQNYSEIEALLKEGTRARSVAATEMNETSSRSHAVISIILTQKTTDPHISAELSGEKVSRISLVDLAGSERASATFATGTRLKEGALINQSLTTLGRVISVLAKNESRNSSKKEKVPFRDSVLTWLLKDSLGGNSKTTMIAAISPADYEETLSTLRYADQAKKIKNKAVVNEDPNAKLVRELKEELQLLRERMANQATEDDSSQSQDHNDIITFRTKEGEWKTISKSELQDQLEASERLMASVTETWEEKLSKTQAIQQEREKALEDLGITIHDDNVGVYAPKKMPHLINLNEDPLMSECIIYQIRPGINKVGNIKSQSDIKLTGDFIDKDHCYFEQKEDGDVILHALNTRGLVLVNGYLVSPSKPIKLSSGDRIILGKSHVFRFNHPEQVRRAREINEGDSAELGKNAQADADQSEKEPKSIDWNYARQEAIVVRLKDGLNGNVDLENLANEDLDKLYSQIMRVRHSRTASSAISGEHEHQENHLSTTLDSVFGGSPRSVEKYDGDEKYEAIPFNNSIPFASSTPIKWKHRSVVSATSTDDTFPLDRSNMTLQDHYTSTNNADEEETGRQIGNMSSSLTDADDARKEKDVLVEKLKTLEAELTKYSISEETVAREKKRLLMRRIVSHWQRLCRVKLAEDSLSKAVLLKEANVLSRELDKNVSYQFMVLENEVPHIDTHDQQEDDGEDDDSDWRLEFDEDFMNKREQRNDYDGVQQALFKSSTSQDPYVIKPCVVVKVIDKHHNCMSTWSLENFEQRLSNMRHVHTFLDRPEYLKHFSILDPFYGSNVSSPENVIGDGESGVASTTTGDILSYLGYVLVPLSPLARGIYEYFETYPLFSPYTYEILGYVEVALSVRLYNTKAAFTVTIGKAMGLSEDEIEKAFFQVKSTSFVKGRSRDIKLFDSDMALVTEEGEIDVTYECSFEADITPQWKTWIAEEGYAPIYMVGTVKPFFLEKIEQYDAACEGTPEKRTVRSNSLGSNARPPKAIDVSRKHEDELVTEQTYDVIARIDMLELDEEGEYAAAKVYAHNELDQGEFILHQGIQRRMSIQLSHNSGRGFEWSGIRDIKVGNVRMKDDKGHIHSSPPSVTYVTLRPSSVSPSATLPTFASETGLSRLEKCVPFDSSLLGSPFLNKPTPGQSRVLLSLEWTVDYEKVQGGIKFKMDVALRIEGREKSHAKTSGNTSGNSSHYFFPWPSLWGNGSGSGNESEEGRRRTKSNRPRTTYHGTSHFFEVKLLPRKTKKSSDIWRLNTADKYVRGEEVLHTWRSRGISLVYEYDKRSLDVKRWADVKAMCVLLRKIDWASLPSPRTTDPDELKRKVIALWKGIKTSDRDVEIVAKQPEDMIVLGKRSPVNNSTSGGDVVVYSAGASLIAKDVSPVRKGTLWLLKDASSNTWDSVWAVVRRPYLIIYTDSKEEDPEIVLNLTSVRIEHSPELDELLDRPYAFGLFTQQSSYFLADPASKDAMAAWIKSIDPGLV